MFYGLISDTLHFGRAAYMGPFQVIYTVAMHFCNLITKSGHSKELF